MMAMGTYVFPRRKEEALIAKLRKAKDALAEENQNLKDENSRLVTKTRALEENLRTMETKLRIQRHAWEELAKIGNAAQPTPRVVSSGVSKILMDVRIPTKEQTEKPPMPSLNLNALSKDVSSAAHRPASSRPMSARPMSGRPVSARPVSARPPSGRPDSRVRPFSARCGDAACLVTLRT